MPGKPVGAAVGEARPFVVGGGFYIIGGGHGVRIGM